MANGGAGHTRVTALYAAASVCGAIVAHASTWPIGWPLIGGYVAAVAILGGTLDRGLQTAPPR
jgi:hypothetical protein